MPACRLIIDPPGEGAWNMSVDEAILDHAEQTGAPVLRFYRWHPATLSLGYFQSLKDRATHLESLNCPVVRRSSGGGAIVHDGELTYSLTLPRRLLPAGKPTGQVLYGLVHQAFISTVSRLTPQAGTQLRQETEPPKVQPRDQPFLCFQRRAPGDVVFGDSSANHKILGSAQRRRDGAVLQHGSLLLRRSAQAPQLPGLVDLAGQELDLDALTQAAAQQIAAALSFDLRTDTITTSEAEAARAWLTRRYGNDAYLRRR